MNEYTRKIDLQKMPVPKITGHTRIELTTVKTGEKKIIEHDNTFQSQFLASYLRSLGAANNSPFSVSEWRNRPLWRNLCGGIFLFRDEITAPAEYMPAGNLMVANGSFGVTNNGTPAELGSYNSIESSTGGANSIALVFDWGTSQGNGTISCVCLTSEVGGFIGYGNASGEAAENAKSILELQSSQANGSVFYYGGEKYYVASVNMTAKKVKIWKAIDQITKASIFQGQDDEETEYTYSGDVVGQSNATQIITRRISQTEFAIMPCDSYQTITIANGSTARILIFNVSTGTLRAQEIANTSGGELSLSGPTNNNCLNLISDSDGNYYISKSNGELAKFNSAGAYQGIAATHSGILAPKGILTPDLLYIQPGYGNSDVMYIFDGTNERITNGYAARNGGAQLDYLSSVDAICYAGRGAADMAPFKNPLYLATINNLDSPVTKDSTQTMKVIYTLTEAS